MIKKFSLEESESIMENEVPEEIERDLQINGKFYEALNEYFVEIRKN